MECRAKVVILVYVLAMWNVVAQRVISYDAAILISIEQVAFIRGRWRRRKYAQRG